MTVYFWSCLCLLNRYLTYFYSLLFLPSWVSKDEENTKTKYFTKKSNYLTEIQKKLLIKTNSFYRRTFLERHFSLAWFKLITTYLIYRPQFQPSEFTPLRALNTFILCKAEQDPISLQFILIVKWFDEVTWLTFKLTSSFTKGQSFKLLTV